MKIIKREIVIEAPIAKVWEHITDPQKIAGWLMPNDFEARVGKKFFIDCPQKGKISCVVKEIIPNEKLVYNLQSETPKADSLVTITLAQEGKATRVTLVHSGWDALPPAEQDQADDYGDGWGSGLEQLRLQIKTQIEGKKMETKTEKNHPRVVSRAEWLTARLDLLKAEKELTRRSDELARRRQELPWVRIDKEYRFDTDEGGASLKDLFRGRSQLLVYHYMFGPDYTAGCATCSTIADGFDGFAVHLANHDVTLSAVSRAPLAKLQAYQRRMGWTFPWVSSLGSDFNFDFNVSFTEEQQREGSIEYNYERGGHAMDATQVPEPVAQNAAMTGTDVATYTRDRPGMSAFVLEDGVVYHTYSAYSRGLDGLWGMYQWLDRAPKGRNENETGIWWRRHDEYNKD